MQLAEKHRKFAEEKIRGTPMIQISEKLGVTRQTLYNWEKDPVWFAYYEQLLADVEAVRTERLTPVVEATRKLLEQHLALGNSILETVNETLPAALASRDFEQVEQLRAMLTDVPNPEVVTRMLDKLVGLERVERGRPSKITEARTAKGDVADRGTQKMLGDAFERDQQPEQPGDEPEPQPGTDPSPTEH